MKTLHYYLLFALLALSCGAAPQSAPSLEVDVPTFSAEEAYAFVASQCQFGPRLLGSDAHDACGDHLVQVLTSYGAAVIQQPFEASLYDGTAYPARNIIAAFSPEKRKRLMLCAHWDSRPWADNDPDPANHRTPVMGANDGASGVAVLLEIARHLSAQQPELGVDILLFDAEDYGAPQFYEGQHDADLWCLGSQYWSRHPHVPDYNPRYAILLDMVGGADATFFQEGYSRLYAPGVVEKVWQKAADLGFAATFPTRMGGYVTDDHLPVNAIAKIPCVDIIPSDERCEQSSFGPTWHTVSDTLDNIDPETLRRVGQVLLDVIYNEK